MFYALELFILMNILSKLSKLESKSINFVFDKAITIEFDIESNNLILCFDKVFFKTFKNNILMSLFDNEYKLKNSNYFEDRIEFFKYKVFESIQFDSNLIFISIPLFLKNMNTKKRNFKPLIEICNYIYNAYNFKGLNYKDKQIARKIKNYTYYIDNTYNLYIKDSSYFERIHNEYRNKKGIDYLISYLDIPLNEYTYLNEYKNRYNQIELKTINNKAILKTFIDSLNNTKKGFKTFKVKNDKGIAINVYFKTNLQFTLLFEFESKQYKVFFVNKKINKFNQIHNLFDLISYYKFIDKESKKFKDLKVIKI